MYGGTKTEMQRLVTDAEKLDDKFQATRDKNGDLTLSFADIVDAIHIVQDNLGITGTSAEEASTTIQGSMASVKAAWQDTLTAIGSGKDLDEKLDNLKNSVSKFGDNIKPTLKTSLKGAVSVVTELAPSVAKELPKLVVELAPDLLKCGANIVSNLAGAILDEIPKLKLGEHAKELGTKLNEMIDKVDAKAGGEEFADVINEVIDAAFNLVKTFDVTDSAKKLTDWFNSAVKNINWKKLGETVGNAWKGVWDFIRTSIKEINWENVGEKLSEFINNINWSGILNSMFETIGEIIKNTPKLLRGVVRKMDFENAAGLFSMLFAPKMASNLLKTIKEDANVGEKLTKSGENMGGKVGGGLIGKFSGAASGIVGKISSGLKVAGVLTAAFQIGWEIGTQIKKGLDNIGWGKWIDDKVNSLMSVVTAGERAKATDTDIKADAQKQLAKFKKAGIKYLTENDVISGSAAYRKAAAAIGFADKYGGTATQYIYNEDLYNKAKAGKLPHKDWTTLPAGTEQDKKLHLEQGSTGFDPKHYQAKTGQASSLGDIKSLYVNSAPLDVYLDTGALISNTVNGYSNENAQNYNVIARGLAT